MDVTIAGSLTSFTPNNDELSGINLEFAAFDGETAFGQFPMPDPSAAISVNDGRQFKLVEIATLITDGFVVDQDRVRGPEPASTAREHQFSVMDANALLDGFRVQRTRPAETDRARVLAFAALDGPTWDTTWVLNESTVTMPAKTYAGDGGWTGELIPDLVDYTGKVLFLHDKALGGTRCLHYHNLTSGHTSGLIISDTPTADGITTFAPGNPTRQQTGIDIRNDIYGTDQSGRTSTASDATSITNHNADGLLHQELVQFDTVSQADLDAQVAARLFNNKEAWITYGCTIGPLDATALSKIRVGDLITVTSSVMGLTSSAKRIAHMTLKVFTGKGGQPAPGLYDAVLELNMPKRRRARGKAGLVKAVIPPGGVPGSSDCCPPFDGIGTPDPGQPVLNEFVANGNGVTTSWTTTYPYAASSLRVWVDNINVTSAKTESNPATGAFALSFAPLTGERIVVSYNGA